MGSTLIEAPHKVGVWHLLAQMGTAHRHDTLCLPHRCAPPM